MATRLWHETKILNNFQAVRFVRIVFDYQLKEVICYVGDEKQELSDELKSAVESFLREEGSAHHLFRVIPYTQIRNTNITEIIELPHEIRYEAITGHMNQQGVLRTIQKLFPHLELKFAGIKNDTNFTFRLWIGNPNVSEVERTILKSYLQELMPLGIIVEVI